MLILDLWGISFHAVVVFGLGKNLLFKSILGRCGSKLLSNFLKCVQLVYFLKEQLDRKEVTDIRKTFGRIIMSDHVASCQKFNQSNKASLMM